MNRIDNIKELLMAEINDAHGDGYDTVELGIETAKFLLQRLERYEAALKKIQDHGDDRPDCYPLYNIAEEALKEG